MHRLLGVTTLLAVSMSILPARADDGTVDARTTTTPTRAFLYVDDARTPGKNEIVGVSRVTLTSGSDAMRPFASNLARPGGVLEAGAEVGLTSSVSFAMTGFNDGFYGLDSTSSGASGAVRFMPFGDGPTRLVTSVGVLRDLRGYSGVFSRATFATDVGRFRVGSTLHAEHLFDPTRDALDLMITAGVSYAVSSAARLGLEYVAQDLEGAVDPWEREGVRHFVGPTLGWTLANNLSATAGPAVGLSASSPRTVGRFALVYAF